MSTASAPLQCPPQQARLGHARSVWPVESTTHLSPHRPHGHARSRSLSLCGFRPDKAAPQASNAARSFGVLTPPASRRSSVSVAPEFTSSGSHLPTAKSCGLSTPPRGRSEEASFPGETVDPPASRPRSRSKCHQRSRSACLPPGDLEFSIPNYARSTERSRSRMVHINSHKIDQRLLADGHKVDEPMAPSSSPQVFSVTFPSSNTDTLRINASSAFRLEIRILAANTIELVAVPVAPEVETASPPLPPSPDSVESVPDADIPELNVSTPVELCAMVNTAEAPVLLAVQPPSPSYVDTPVPHLPSLPTPPPPPPQTAEEHHDALRKFVTNRQLSNFFPTGSNASEDFLVDVSNRAAELIRKLGQGSDTDAQNTFLANPEIVAEVAKLTLYDHVLFCDDSSSMGINQRMDALKQTIKQVANIAIALKETSQHDGGISIRFLNYENDGHMNNICSVADVEQALYGVGPYGATELGTQLKKKILEPFLVNVLEKAKRKLERPLLVTIITDGEPCGEDRDTLKNTILWCKKYMEKMGYGPWAVGFHIVQIGDSPSARAFLREIEGDEEVKQHVYVSTENIADGRVAGVSQPKLERENDLWWVKSLLKAIEH